MITLQEFKDAYDKKGKGALDYEKFQSMLDSLAPIPDRQDALAHVKSKSEADYNVLVTKFGQTPEPSAPPAGRRRRGKKTAKKTKGKRKTRRGSKSRRH